VPSLRHHLLRLLRIALRLRAHPLVLTEGALLVIAPHPDDETLGCAGLIHRQRLADQRVSCLFLTDGSASHRNHPRVTPQTLAALRADEARAATSVLGVAPHELEFLGLPDGKLPHLTPTAREQAIQDIAACVTRLAPATILITHRHDGSSEHEASFPLLHAALRQIGQPIRVIEYPVWTLYSPRLLFRFFLNTGHLYRVHHPSLRTLKTRALANYVTQFAPLAPWTEPVQSADFANAFSHNDEFFVEIPL